MTSGNRFVFDTNVIISAVLVVDSVPGRAFIEAMQSGTILVSRPLIEELSDVPGREKLSRYVTLPERDLFIDRLGRESELVEIKESIRACRDPDDDKILELAVSGQATLIVSGDQDLLEMNSFRDIPIVTPARMPEKRQ